MQPAVCSRLVSLQKSILHTKPWRQRPALPFPHYIQICQALTDFTVMFGIQSETARYSAVKGLTQCMPSKVTQCTGQTSLQFLLCALHTCTLVLPLVVTKSITLRLIFTRTTSCLIHNKIISWYEPATIEHVAWQHYVLWTLVMVYK